METRLRVAVGAFVWAAMVGIAVAQTPTGIPKETQLNPGRVTAGNGNLIVIGCVSRQGQGASPSFIITDPRPKPPAQYRLDGDADLLRMHVGHTVEVGGPVTQPSGGNATPTLKMQSLTYISTTCAAPPK
jgi:hypothetical protein